MLTEKTKDAAQRIGAQYRRTLDEIRADRSRSPEWKRSAMARLYADTKGRVDALLAADKAASQTRQRALEAQIFGISDLLGDTGSLSISRRDAGDRAAQITDESAALELLARAERSGDQTLARAIAERALQSRWMDVANAFLETRPQFDAAFSELWNHEEATLREEMHEAMELSIHRPDELSGVNDAELDSLVSEGDATAVALNSPALLASIG